MFLTKQKQQLHLAINLAFNQQSQNKLFHTGENYKMPYLIFFRFWNLHTIQRHGSV